MNDLNMKISKMKSTLNKMKTELSAIQHQTHFSPVNSNSNQKKYISSSSMQNILYKEDSNNLDKPKKISSYKSTRNQHTKHNTSKDNNNTNTNNIIENTLSEYNKPPLYKTLNRINSYSNNIHQRNKTNHIDYKTIQQVTNATNYKDAGFPSNYLKYQARKNRSRSNANSSQNSLNNSSINNIINKTTVSYKQYNNKNHFKRETDNDYGTIHSYNKNNIYNNNVMFIDFTKGAALNHKVKENGWKSSKYKCRSGSSNEIYSEVNNKSTKTIYNNVITKDSIYSNNIIYKDKNSICDSIIKALSTIYGFEQNIKLLIQKINKSNQISTEMNSYLKYLEGLYENEHKHMIEYDKMKKWIQNKSKKLDLYKKELSLYIKLCEMIQNVSPLSVSEKNGYYGECYGKYCHNNRNYRRNKSENCKEGKYDFLNKSKNDKVFNKKNGNEDVSKTNQLENNYYNLNY